MATAQKFAKTVLPTVKKIHAQTGILISVLLAMMALTTGWGTNNNWVITHNPGGIKDGPPFTLTGNFTAYPTREAGIAAWIHAVFLQKTYTAARAAVGYKAQCVAFGNSPMDAGHFTYQGQGPGTYLIELIQENNWTSYDTATSNAVAATTLATNTSTQTATGQTGFTKTLAAFNAAYSQIKPPPVVFGSSIGAELIAINGVGLATWVGPALVTAQLELTITQVPALTLTLLDPTRILIQNPIFSQASTLSFNQYIFELFGVEKNGSVLTVTFIPWVVAALMKATGPFTVTPGVVTRTTFARILIQQVYGAYFAFATPRWLYNQREGYDHLNKEQLCRGTAANPTENSWAALQRLAAEIQWTCFCTLGDPAGGTALGWTIYFGPYKWLVTQTPVLIPQEFQLGITTITGTFTIGQPLGEITITAVANSWTPFPGQCVKIGTLGPFNGSWIVAQLTRPSITQPTIAITLQQPLPGLPEPATGGTTAAVASGAGTAQSTGGETLAGLAVAYALAQVGKAYSETWNRREGPTSFDCSGLVYQAWKSAGILIGNGSTPDTTAMWPNGANLNSVPPGMQNLVAGDLLFFSNPGTPRPTAHVAMVTTVNANGTVNIVEAANPTIGVITETGITVTVGGTFDNVLTYLGALRPAVTT